MICEESSNCIMTSGVELFSLTVFILAVFEVMLCDE